MPIWPAQRKPQLAYYYMKKPLDVAETLPLPIIGHENVLLLPVKLHLRRKNRVHNITTNADCAI